MSYRNIVKQVKQMGHNFSVHHMQHRKGAIRNNIRKTGKSGSFTKRQTGTAAAPT
jgi:hypothetical protein